MNLNGKTILVSGAGGLLGFHVVKALLKNDANVIATDIDEILLKEKLSPLSISAAENKLTILKLDVTNEESVKAFFNENTKLDGAVNASYPRNKTYGSHFFDVSLESFNENLSLHLGSAFLFTQQTAAYFNKHKRHFSLVNISSIYGVIAPKFDVYDGTEMTMPVEYSAIKSAILHLSKYTVKYVADSRYRINCISPGGIFDNQPEAFLESYKAQTNGAGMLEVEEMMGSIMFLLSEDSRFVTGQNIIIDDGFSL